MRYLLLIIILCIGCGTKTVKQEDVGTLVNISVQPYSYGIITRIETTKSIFYISNRTVSGKIGDSCLITTDNVGHSYLFIGGSSGILYEE